ncbi:NAD(P)H-binding protein [Paucibacter sp. R3-3]|uniref:NAD(P)H-binding protein n=1 Tax=Roseateles agri TaxID=3098619 RepID=A0ABU5DMF6_9BURK|nr:NmrA family NAD(P)-binding protein [Paucibacter sp. R3-3]MDY0746913.1 NAD(P)H-binding protein [Paucibacter sp. R3-3]
MFAITGITGQVGGALARTLLAQGKPVRAVVRDAAKGGPWRARGCEVALADIGDATALAQAFRGCEGVFLLLPPTFDPSPDFSEAAGTIAAMRAALLEAQPGRVVVLSTIGARAAHTNLLSQLGMLEAAMADLPMPVTVLRPGWFIENLVWDIPAARERGEIESLLQPLDRAVPMVATEDVGRTAAELLLEATTQQHRVVELEGPQRLSPADLAAALSRALGKSVHAVVVAREQWETRFHAQGMRNPQPRMRMLDGFNEGWIAFEGATRQGSVTLDKVLATLLASD